MSLRSALDRYHRLDNSTVFILVIKSLCFIVLYGCTKICLHILNVFIYLAIKKKFYFVQFKIKLMSLTIDNDRK